MYFSLAAFDARGSLRSRAHARAKDLVRTMIYETSDTDSVYMVSAQHLSIYSIMLPLIYGDVFFSLLSRCGVVACVAESFSIFS